ncbi:MAG: hypothetical protein ACRCVT_05810 [Leadbetterella sp.]
MKNIYYLFIILVSSCVQKSYEQTLRLQLDVSGHKDIQTVGVRGEGKPLSWQEDIEMKPIVKDSLYEVVITGKTGYLFQEIKFTINGEFEFADGPNRRVNFDPSRKTTYKAKFNIPNP